MSCSYLCSDSHLDHENIYKQRSMVGSVEENTELFLRDYSVVKPDDVVIFCGDVAFKPEALHLIRKLKGRKILVKGNHDTLNFRLYSEIFENIFGSLFKYGFQITHVPVHPNSLRNRVNVHGHLHSDVVRKETLLSKLKLTQPKPDNRYFNCCPENLYDLADKGLLKRKSSLIKVDEIREYLKNLR